MPVADAGVGLPRIGEDALRLAALDVQRDRADVIGLQALAVDDHVEVALVADRRVVIVRGECQAILLEGQLGVVEVDQVGLVGVDQVLAAQEPVLGELGIVRRNLFVPFCVVGLVPVVGLRRSS